MTKSDLIARLVGAHRHLKRHDIEIIVATVFGEIASALSRGDRVELRGFGAFSVKRYNARFARNPRTRVSVDVAERSFPSFKPSKMMRYRLNP